jgi:hypothetical protein
MRSIDIGMSIHCDDEGKFTINHWPPLPIDDSVIILQMLQVGLFKRNREETDRYAVF